ncbi:nucleolin 2 [Culex quinquefasciatus]|uniref:nucleolin 2 n=1 Tax=Culex quinquefasciatus TaxID=7176 RepID=UPI0018E2F6D2|nr:nucleolin 2 [Culex quinquefasciatus]
MQKVLGCLVVVCACLIENHVEAEQNALQRIALAVAKGKELLDRGIKIQSERQDSVDFFGTKVDTSFATKQGFGDAVKEGSTDSFEDDLVRKKRTIDVLEYLRSQGLFTNSASGTNVNIVKINSVSNVNNYGPTPAEATTAASRRRRSLKYVAADETVSIMTSDDEMKRDGSFRGRTAGEIHKAHVKKLMVGFGKGDLKKAGNKRMVPVLYKSWDEKVSGYLSESRMKPNGSLKTHTISQSDDTSNRGVVVGAKSADELDDEVPMRYERSLEEVRAKRSPQEIDEDVTTEKPRCGGKGKRGPGGGGRGGRRGGGRGRGSPPPPPEDGAEADTDDVRMKREIKQSSQNDIQNRSVSTNSVRSTSVSTLQSDSQAATESDSESESNSDSEGSDSGSDSSSSSSSDSDSDSDSSSSETQDPEPNSASEVSDGTSTPRSIRSKRSPCGGRRQQVTTTVAPAMMRRAKRDATTGPDVEELDEEQQKVHSWFSTVVETIVESAKRVSAAVRRVFGRGEQGGDSDAESYNESANPNAETMA